MLPFYEKYFTAPYFTLYDTYKALEVALSNINTKVAYDDMMLLNDYNMSKLIFKNLAYVKDLTTRYPMQFSTNFPDLESAGDLRIDMSEPDLFSHIDISKLKIVNTLLITTKRFTTTHWSNIPGFVTNFKILDDKTIIINGKILKVKNNWVMFGLSDKNYQSFLENNK